MSKDNLPEEQTPRTEEAPAENQAEETTLPSPEEESAAAAENEADTSVETVEQEDGEPAQEKRPAAAPIPASCVTAPWPRG